MPEGKVGESCGAGCVQRVDLPDGTILLPVYHREKGSPFAAATVLRCGFDGTKLTLLEIGDTLKFEQKRGYAEPSLAADAISFPYVTELDLFAVAR